jgi:RimJ/RimL family protein N-acetyltransferase
VSVADGGEFTRTPLLANDIARLEPLTPAHAADLSEAVAVDELWRTWYTRIPSPDAMADEIESRLARQRAGTLAPWAILDARSGRAVGMTTYLNIDAPNRRLEIGSTWIGAAAQGGGVNPAAKLLLLDRAFETLECIAVEFRTHWHNHQSRAAIARLGAKQDGVLRNHSIWADGTLRDTVVFSILDGEWPTVRTALAQRLARHRR